MPISHERRYYLTLPDRAYKNLLVRRAEAAGMTVSDYIIARLAVLDAVENTNIGSPLVKAVEQSLQQAIDD